MFHQPAHRELVSILLVLVGIGFSVATAQAAPLAYSTAETVSLSSPATAFTITTSSVADTLQVNATSVIVTMSSSTGGSFTLTSASYNLTIASSSGGGTVTLSCTSGVASTTITQTTGQTNYTISPAASQCTSQSGGGGGGGGGGGITVGVASGYGSPYIPGVGLVTTSTPSSTTLAGAANAQTSTAGLQAQLNSLLALLASLQAQAAKQGAAGTASAVHLFRTALQLRDVGPDVTFLQKFLGENKTLYPEGKITGYFGSLTLRAVQRFQKKYGIAKVGDKAYGYVGPATRAKLNSLIETGLTP